MLSEKNDVKKRWTVNFERLLNVDEDREAEIVAGGWEQGLHMLRELNDLRITKEKVQEAIREITG